MLLIKLMLFFQIWVHTAAAKTTIIHATGIDPDYKSQNFEVFYENSARFQKFCDTFGNKRGLNCTLLMNADPKFAKDGNNKGVKPNADATRASVLKNFEDALKATNPPDQVALSLDNHGAPSEKAKSCVYLNDKDKICENDIIDLIKKYKKPGVKVLVSADACFSGGFAEAANQEVCVITRSSDATTGKARPGLWESVFTEMNLDEMIMPVSRLDGYDLIRGSELILAQICQKNLKEFQAEWGKFDQDSLKDIGSLIHYMQSLVKDEAAGKDCSVQAIGIARTLKVFQRSEAMVLQNPLKFCEKPNDERKLVCDAVNRLTKQAPLIARLDQILKAREAALEDFERQYGTVRAALDEVLRMPASTDAKPQGGAKKDNIASVLAPNGRTKKIRELTSQSQDLIIKQDKALETAAAEMRAIVRDPNFLEFSKDLNQVTTCLLAEPRAPTEEEKKYLKVNSDYVKGITKPVTMKQYQDARQCETSFRF